MKPLEAVAFKLAVLLHDPPWKPWGISKSGYRIGFCNEAYDACIARQVAKYVEDVAKGRPPKPLQDIVDKLSGSNEWKDIKGELLKAIEEAANAWIETSKSNDKPRSLESHEKQSLLLAHLIEAILEKLDLKNYLQVAKKTKAILNGSDVRLHDLLKRVDVLASALDRAYLTLIYGGEGSDSSVEAKNQVYVNPFNPKRRMSVNRSLGVDKIAQYIVALLVSTTYFLIKARKNGNDDNLLLYSLVYSLLEPLWYLITGPGYVPVADTRVPTHTVFDHVAAATMIANWLLHDSGPSGCLAIVDLKSVQMWIGESRRLRDIWAASWLASWLAWETVRPLVERHGPDVMLQPPARLHPFYASWLLSRLGCNNTTDEECSWLAKLLALPHGWPLDPTVPTMTRLVLPMEDCDMLQTIVLDAYKKAWKKVIDKVADYIQASVELAKEVEAICRNRGGCKTLDGKEPVIARVLAREDLSEELHRLIEAVRNLEPPLPLQIRIRNVQKAREKAAEIAKEVEKQGFKVREKSLIDMLFYQILVDDRYWESEEAPLAGFRATGRRSGKAYLDYSRELYNAGHTSGKRLFYNCHVCGVGAAIVDGSELQALLRAVSKGSGLDKSLIKLIERVARLTRNVQGERLCPYCLAKRMLRDMLYYDGLARELVGLEMPRVVYDRLGRVTVDYYTSRLHINARYLAYKVREIVKEYPEAILWLHTMGFTAPNKFIEFLPYMDNRSEYEDYIKSVYKEYREAMEKRGYKSNEILGFDKFRELLVTVESIVMEAVHDLALPKLIREEASEASKVKREIAEELERLAKNLEEITRNIYGRRVYALVINDGDKMGTGVLSGYLGKKPERYVREVAEAAGLPPSLVEDLVDFYEGVVKVYENSFAKNRSCMDKRTVIVTPSYHQAVSRALAVQSILDREVVEKLGGLFLYSGGDDATAILPPVEPNRGQICVIKRKGRVYAMMEPLYPALAAAAAMRRLYWGLTPLRTRDVLSERLRKTLGRRGTESIRVSSAVAAGFNAATLGPSDRVTTIVPALVAYGRSTVIYYVGVKEPFWRVFSEAHGMLDEKDNIVFIKAKNKDYVEKDVLIVAGSAGAAILPLSRGEPDDYEAAASIEEIIELLRQEAWRVQEPHPWLDREDNCPRLRGLSASFFNDAKLYALEAFMSASQGRNDAVMKLAEYLVSRNIVAGNKAEKREIAKRVITRLKEMDKTISGALPVSAYQAKENGVLKEFLGDGFSYEYSQSIPGDRCGHSNKGKWFASSSLFQVFNAARITRSAR